MSKQASAFQEKEMSILYRGKEIFKPLNTGRIDERVSCVREFIADIFFYTKAYDGYDESGDTEEKARSVRLKKQQGMRA